MAAYNKENAETDASEPFSATTRGRPPVPGALKAKSGEPRRVNLEWTAINSPEDEIKGYLLYRASGSQGPYKKITDVAPAKNTFVDNNPPLQDNTNYFYKISSYNSVNAESAPSDPVSATTKAVPKAPAGLKAAPGEVKKVSLSWEGNLEKDIREYVVYRKSREEVEMDKLKAVKQTSYVDSGLKDGLEYTYAVQAVDQDNLASLLSPSAAARTKPLPQKITGLKVTESDGKRAISWEASPEKDVKQYTVYRKNFLGILQKITSVSSNTWAIEGLKGKNDLVVTANDESGLESEGSDPLAVELK